MKTTRFFVGLMAVLMLLFYGCEKGSFIDDSLVSTSGKKGEPTEIAGNNLSFPVIWSDGVEKPLRGTYGVTKFDGIYFTADGYDWYVQNDPNNEWQAQSLNAISENNGQVHVSSIDWGDNLESKSWAFGSQVRVETVLYKALDNPMTGYEMKIEDETQMGTIEVWGTNGVTYDSDEATIYSGTAKLVIQKLTKTRDDPGLQLTWNNNLSQWTGDVEDPLFASGVWEATEGPGDYNAEINVQGKVIYGYNWVTRKTASGAGDYRLTFVLDHNSPVTYNTDFDQNTIIVPREEEGEVTTTEEPELEGGVAVISHQHNLTYIDVRLTLKNGSSHPGNGGGNGGSGNGSGKGAGK